MKILVTGGTGYIGSHTVIELINLGYDVVIVDNLSNSKLEVLNRIKTITNVYPKFYQEDVCNEKALDKIFKEEKIDAVIHFAGLKAVGESVAKPIEYYQNNIFSTISLINAMKKAGCKNLIFSSSATVYGNPERLPLTEDCKTGGTTNPYGTTKLFIEQILKDLHHADESWNIILLRYFNPIGAHESGLIGEDPNGIPNNLVPYITQVAIKKLPFLRVFGNDYHTHDGTGVRDYIHVCDLAVGHVCAIKKLLENCGLKIYNLGTGVGYSVLDVLHAFEKAVGHPLPYQILERRPGDIDACFADGTKAYIELGFKTKKTLDDMAKDSWNWQKNNPNGLE